jgi:hypothetical protein
VNALEKFIKIMQTEMSQPTLYGGAHLLFLGLTILAIVIVCITCKRLSDKRFRIILLAIGSTLIFLEILKQLNFAYDATTDSWEYEWKQFPFQFCSVPMYVMILVASLRECKFRDYLCSFLATFGLFAGLVVMIYPNTILSSIIFRFSQSMIHHSSMLIVGILMYVSGKVKINHKTFLKALPVFVVCVVIAFIMNIIFHSTGNTNSFNMFYIGPYNKCDIPILNSIGAALNIQKPNLHFGNFVFILIYIVGFSIAAYLILLASMLINKINSKFNKKKSQ